MPNKMPNTPLEVIFLSYDEPNANENFARLREFAPHAKRVHGIEGIGNAHRKAAEVSSTDYLFVVDADNWILDGFKFEFPESDLAGKHLWYSRNAVNGTIWRNGAVKLLNRHDILAVERAEVDFFLSIKGEVKSVDVVCSETRFNYSPFLAWRAGFRECTKLAARSTISERAQEILEIWQNMGAEKVHGNWCILGSKMGAAFGRANAGTASLRLINDMAWLRSEFARCLEEVSQDENLLDMRDYSA